MGAIDMQVVGLDALKARFASIASRAVPQLQSAMLGQMARVAEHVRGDYLSGQVLHRRSGKLSRGIHPDAQSSGTEITGIVAAGADTPYAVVHERGGSFPVPEHTRLQVMAWGRPILPREVSVSAHSATYPQRAFLAPGLADRRDQVVRGLQEAVRAVLSGA